LSTNGVATPRSRAGLEGLYLKGGVVYFSASDGGDAERGQIWQYIPVDLEHGKLTLLYESADKDILDGPDNICISPRGLIVIAEDGDGGSWIDGDDSCRQGGDNYVRFIATDGVAHDFARVPKTLDLVLEDFGDFEEDCTGDLRQSTQPPQSARARKSSPVRAPPHRALRVRC